MPRPLLMKLLKPLASLALGACCAASSAVWAAQPACSAQPFADESAAQQEQRLARTCSGTQTQWSLETPRARPVDPGPSLTNARFSSAVTRTLDDWRNTLQLDWAGTRTETASGMRTAQATLAAASLFKLDDWAVHFKLGREMAGAPSTRAAVTSLWQPTRSALVFAEWAGTQTGTQAHRLGARWWPVPGLMAFDFVARQLPGNTAWVDQRVSLTLQFQR